MAITHKLTESYIKNLTRDVSVLSDTKALRDGCGLRLDFTKNKIVWRYEFRFDGKNQLLTIGEYPAISLADARKLHLKAIALKAQGVNPALEKQKAKEQRKQQEALKRTLAVVVTEWFAHFKEDKRDGYAKKTWQRIQKDILIEPYASMLIEQFRRTTIIEMLERPLARDAKDVTKRLAIVLHDVFEYALDKGYLSDERGNPADLRHSRFLKATTRKTSQAHPFLTSESEFRAFMQDLAAVDYGAQTKIAQKLLIHTFVRVNELLNAQWCEFDFTRRVWLIPAERSKMAKAHEVYLTDEVLTLLTQLRALHQNHAYLFPPLNRASQSLTMTSANILKMVDKMGYKGRVDNHGWRSFASTMLNESSGVSAFLNAHPNKSVIIEALLAHSLGGVAKLYNYSKHGAEREKVMVEWSKWIGF